MSDYIQTDRTRLRLYHELGSYDRDFIHNIIDEAPMCHLSAVVDGSPYIQGTVHWRDGEKVMVHGAVKNKMINAIRKGAEACLSFSHFDGYLLPRSGFNHAVLYRSVIAYAMGRFVEDLDEKREMLRLFLENIQPGRWDQIRQPSLDELKQTGIVEFQLGEVSAKSIPREMAPLLMPGGEMEDPADADYNPWTGIIPYELNAREPVSAGELIGE